MAREANVFVRDPDFANQLREELARMIDDGSQRVRPQHWALRPRPYKAFIWLAYGVVRAAMGLLGYGGNEWFRGRRRKPRVWLPLHRGAP